MATKTRGQFLRGNGEHKVVKAFDLLCGLSEKEFGIVLHMFSQEHANNYAWPASRHKAHLKKLDSYLAFFNDRDGKF